jgi:hypothetical protein
MRVADAKREISAEHPRGELVQADHALQLFGERYLGALVLGDVVHRQQDQLNIVWSALLPVCRREPMAAIGIGQGAVLLPI